jgi:hypothetical protein
MLSARPFKKSTLQNLSSPPFEDADKNMGTARQQRIEHIVREVLGRACSGCAENVLATLFYIAEWKRLDVVENECENRIFLEHSYDLQT